MKNILLPLLLALGGAAVADDAKILLVTGMDHPAHDWRKTAPVLRTLLEEDNRLKVHVVENPSFLDSHALTNYSVVLLHFQNWGVPGPGRAAQQNLRSFVKSGGGLVSIHFGCGAWHGEWPEFQQIIGRVWHGTQGSQHDPRGKFQVRITDSSHPVCRNLQDFETDDELYTCLTGDAPIHLLAEATSRVDKRSHPMAFVRQFGSGRVFLTTLGHDAKAMTNSVVPQLFRQGVAWAAGLP